MRRHLRPWAAAWLICQAALLSALVPRACCATHQPAGHSAAHGCQRQAAATACPMRAAGGAACPMHRGSHSGGHELPDGGCSMKGTCDADITAIAVLLSQCGVLTDVFALRSPDAPRSSAAPATREHPSGLLASPEPPPPRA